MTKIIWGINIPYQSQEIDWEATDNKRREVFERTGNDSRFLENTVRVPCIRIYKEMFFVLCDICGEPVPENRAHRQITTCCPAHNKIKNERWALKTLEEERNFVGDRPTFFWATIRDECFQRDGWRCQFKLSTDGICGKDIRLDDKPGESHHIVPISKGGTNKLENLITHCYDHHKIEHSRVERVKRMHKPLEVD